MKKLIVILFLLISSFGFSQQWNTNFNGIDSIWNNLGGNPNIYVLSNLNEELYLGGPFQNVGSLYVSGIAKYDSINWFGFNNGITQVAGGTVQCIELYNNKVFVGGGFIEMDNHPNTEACAVWDGSSWGGISGFPITNYVWDIEIYHDTLFVGYQGGSICIIAYDGNSLINVGSMNANWTKAFAVFNDTLYAGGNFGFRKRTGTTTWEEAHGGTDYWVNDMEVDTINNFLYVGGAFTSVGNGISSYMVAMWDGFEWTSMGEEINCDIYPQAMAVYRGDLYVGGCFDMLYTSGLPINYIARWDGYQWDSLSNGCNNVVDALVVYKDDLYVGGHFTYVDDTIRAYGLAKWHMPDTSCNYLKPRVQTNVDTFFIVNDTAQVQFYNNNAFVDMWSWDFGDTGTASVKNPLHSYTTPGTYNVCVTVNDTGCIKTACKTITILNPTTIAEFNKASGVKIYPNPTTGKITIEAEEIESAEVYNIYGKHLTGFGNLSGLTELDLSPQPKGIYIIKVQTSRGVAVEKVILN